MLLNVAERNINGQMKLSVRTYTPASVFANKYCPINEEVSRKNKVLANPRTRQDSIVRRIVRWMSVWFFCAFACEMDGSSITDTEFVSTDGKRIIGIAIPVKIPKILKASSFE